MVIMMWAGQEAKGKGRYRGFLGYLDPYRHFLTVSILIPSSQGPRDFATLWTYLPAKIVGLHIIVTCV